MPQRLRRFVCTLATCALAAFAVAASTLAGATQAIAASPQDQDAFGAHADHGRPLRIATYNIHHGAGNDACTPPPPSTPPAPECALNLERIAEIVREMHVDVIGFQEIDRFWARSGYVDQATRLGALLRMHVCYGGNLDHQADTHADRPHQYGTLILTKRPLLACWNTLLPRASTSTEQRGLLHAVIDAHGVPLHVFNTHLHTTVAERTVQIPAVDALVGETSPAIVIGDLNAQPTESTMAPLQARFQDAWVEAGEGDGFTIPADPDAPPTRRIDYAFATPGITFTDADVVITPDTQMGSDHYPLLVRVRVPRAHDRPGHPHDRDDR